MRKIRTATFVSLDGVMQAPGGPDEDATGGFAFGDWIWPPPTGTFEDIEPGEAELARRER